MLDDDYDDGDESLKTVWLRVWPLVLFKNEEYLRSQDRPLYLVPNIRFFRPRRMGNSRCFRVYLETEIFQDRVDWLLFQKSKTRRNWRNSDEQRAAETAGGSTDHSPGRKPMAKSKAQPKIRSTPEIQPQKRARLGAPLQCWAHSRTGKRCARPVHSREGEPIPVPYCDKCLHGSGDGALKVGRTNLYRRSRRTS